MLAQRYTLAMEKNIDDGVGRIVGYLKENRLYDDTIVIFTTDHGDFLGDYGCLYKLTAPLNCLVHTPLIIKPEKGRGLPKEFNDCVANYDVFPTLLKMAGAKSLCYVQGKEELYNVKTDPSEMQNLAGEDNFSELKRKMKETLLLKHSSYDTRRYGAHAIL